MTTLTASVPPLLLITVDRLPAGLVSPLGCGWIAMPALNSLAARGVVLDRVVATTDDPAQVLAAFAGDGIGIHPGAWPLLLAATECGLSPIVVTDAAWLAAALAPERAAEPHAITICTVPISASTRVAEDEAGTNLGRLFTTAADQVASGAHQFVWVHAESLGTSWDAPEEFRNAYIDPDDPPPPSGASVPDLAVDAATDPDVIVGLRHVMAGQLSLLDHCLGHLLGSIRGAEGPDWTIIVAGVRGLGLGLHGRLGCGPLPPFSELIHLPVVLADHRGRMAAQRFGGLVTPADLGVTLLAGLDRAFSDSADPRSGRSLLPLLDEWQGPDRDRVICTAARGVAVVTPAWHLVAASTAGLIDAPAPSPALYAKPDDFFECSDVADRCFSVAEELAALAAQVSEKPEDAWTTPLSDAAVRGI
jgi:hypothetical protein